MEDYYKSGGYICPSDIFYGRPKRAINTYGQWKVGTIKYIMYVYCVFVLLMITVVSHKQSFPTKVIVNLPDDYYAKGYGKGYEKYTQTQRLEQCM